MPLDSRPTGPGFMPMTTGQSPMMDTGPSSSWQSSFMQNLPALLAAINSQYGDPQMGGGMGMRGPSPGMMKKPMQHKRPTTNNADAQNQNNFWQMYNKMSGPQKGMTSMGPTGMPAMGPNPALSGQSSPLISPMQSNPGPTYLGGMGGPDSEPVMRRPNLGGMYSFNV